MYAISCVNRAQEWSNMYRKLQCQIITSVHLMHKIRDNWPSNKESIMLTFTVLLSKHAQIHSRII